ncbi:MAG TPA: ribosomal protein S18-alanine N-acetyltransferase [Xanthomonadaceae bacterium]|nr:ribosomal protein S18-alanine N-acetyltransferase [Xanthomonadaceae bacterium]
MNARAAPLPASLRPMRETDLDAVMDIEHRAYPFPWTRGIFRDCLRADYPAWVLERDRVLIGYGVLSIAADEAHVLNVCAAPEVQGQGHGRRMLRALLQIARGRGARRVFLEVRPSNRTAIRLYHAEGFNEIGRRPRYYPAADGREDAIVMAMELLPPSDQV